MLRQKQKLVEALMIQLEHGKRGGQAQDPVVFVRVKQEPLEKPSVPPSYGHALFPPSPSSISCKMDFTKVTVKQGATEAEEIMSEATLQSPISDFQFLTPEVKKQKLLKIKPEHTSAKTREEEHIRLRQTTVQLARQQAAKEKLPLQKLKQQVPLRQQTLALKHQSKQQQNIQIQINLKQQQVLIQKNPQKQQQSPQVRK